jgi:arylesterase / paraoxonase
VALLAPYLYDRGQLLSYMYLNAPERLARVNAFPSHEIKFQDKLRSCEDAILVESTGVAIIACDPGRERWNTVMVRLMHLFPPFPCRIRPDVSPAETGLKSVSDRIQGIFIPGPVQAGGLYVYDYKDPSAADSASLKRLELVGYDAGDDFHSLGMSFDEDSSTLLLANHRHDGPHVELFKVHFDTMTAEHLRSIQHPLLQGPNAIATKNEKEFFVTNDHYFKAANNRLLSVLETYLALPLGTVVHVDISDPATVNASIVARVPYANGIEVVNGTRLAVASTSKGAVWFYDMVEGDGPGSAPQLVYRSDVQVPFNADNLALSSDGRMLIAGHPHAPSTFRWARTRYVCNDPVELASADPEMQEYCKTGLATSWVSEWSEEGGLKHLYVDTEYPTSATAARDPARKVGIIAGLYAKGILVWRE